MFSDKLLANGLKDALKLDIKGAILSNLVVLFSSQDSLLSGIKLLENDFVFVCENQEVSIDGVLDFSHLGVKLMLRPVVDVVGF